MAAGIKEKTISARQLTQAGAALMGDRWKRPLARFLGRDQKTLFRWLSGENPIPPDVAPLIYRALLDKEKAAHAARDMLRKA